MTREPAVAGQFYPASAQALKNQIESMLDKNARKQDAIGIVSPHAGYVYSGAVAAAVFSQVNITDTVIILGPNHTGTGPVFSLYAKGRWRTPLGSVDIDSRFCDHLVKSCKAVKADESAHLYEHSLEVQLPFMQYIKKDLKIVPIVLGHSDISSYRTLGVAIADTIREFKKDALIVASSDMTHYESQDNANEKDKIAIGAILKLDDKALLENVARHNISMCGYSAAAVMLAAAKSIGATSAELVKYQTSGDVSGDYSAVVGYAGVIVK